MAAREIFDVIIIGGSTAHEAAVAARYYGPRRVAMLEKAPPSESGGNARFSGTGFRFVFEPEEINEIVGLTDAEYARLRLRLYTAGDFLGDLRQVTRHRIDIELATLLVSESNEAVRWSKEVGMRWELGDGIEVDGLLYFAPGIPIHPLNLGDESGVTGVRVLGPEGVYEIEAPATIACSGGFQANPELRARYLAPTPTS